MVIISLPYWAPISSDMEKRIDPSSCLVVINPVAGNVDLSLVENILNDRLQLPIDKRYLTIGDDEEDQKAIIDLIRRLNAMMVLIAGGDGTISLVANALHRIDQQLPVVLWPLGTGNVIAKEMGYPLDWRAMADQLADCSFREVKLDAMAIGDTLYLSHLSMGYYAQSLIDVQRKDKRRQGVWAYLQSFYHQIQGGRSWRFDIEIDGRSYRKRASLIMLANAGAIGIGGLRWGSNISISDGRINVCVIKTSTLAGYLRFLLNTTTGRAENLESVNYYQARKHIKVQARKKKLYVRGDGELVGRQSMEVRILPGHLRMWLPIP